jgi:uncharacterized caspase-like protein
MRRFTTGLKLAAALAGLMFACAAAQAAADRVALVIGNGAYVAATPLPNPPNDARVIAAALKDIGFDVDAGQDMTRSAMEKSLRDFLRKARTAKVALLFYAGHGMQVDGRNYLLPVDARLTDASDLNFETIKLDELMDNLNDNARSNIVILDACRDNPLARSFSSRLGATRSGAVGAGLAAYSSLGSGTLIAFATAPGQTALDGKGANSPFTQSLARHIRQPGLEIRQMLTRVRADVAEQTGRRQVPWDNSSLFGEVFLAGLPANANTPRLPAPEPVAPDEVHWSVIKDMKVAAVFEEFQTRYPRSARAGEAAAKLRQLNDAAKPNPVVAAVSPKADAQVSASAVPAPQRVVLYDEDPADQKGKQYIGTVNWRTSQVKVASGEPKTDLALIADVSIPDRKLSLSLTIRRNFDRSLPASHVVEIDFHLLPGFQGGGIANVPGMLMKPSEQARGTPLAGLAVKVTPSYFLVGLSNVDADRTKNIQLMNERSWFDVPLVYDNNRRAIVAIEKGPVGERAFKEAFAAWGQ